MQEYILVKLKTGDELLGMLVNKSTHSIALKHPIQMHRSVNAQGNTWVVCSDYLLFCTGDILTLDKDDILFTRSDLAEPVVENYIDFLKNNITNEVPEHEETKHEAVQEDLAKLVAQKVTLH